MRLDPNQLVFRPGPKPWLDQLTFPYRETFILELKQFPGCRYAPEIAKGVWVAPSELRQQISELAEEFHLVPNLSLLPKARACSVSDAPNPKLYPYQTTAVSQALLDRRHMLNYEMGLGKTPAAIEVCRLSAVPSALIICPAMVRLNWADELDKWWPNHPEVQVIETGKQIGASCAPIKIISYELLPNLPISGCAAIIIDEAHYVGNGRAGRSKSVRAVVEANPDAIVLMLTGTPITNQPKTLHNQLDIMFPGRFGSWCKFNKRYSEIEANAYSSWIVKGLKEEHAPELRSRLSAISSRVTKKEVAHLLPPCLVQSMRIRPSKKFDARELLDGFNKMDAHTNKCEELIRAAGSEKVHHAVEFALDGFENNTHVAVLTHFRETAREIAAAMEAECPDAHVTLVTGDDTPSARTKLIADCRASKKGVLVATMHSVNVGIDLTFCTLAIFAELDYTPSNMIQACGRFSRLSGTLPSTIYLLVLEGTQDELIAHRLEEKISDINSAIKAGQAEGALQSAFDLASDQTDEDFMAELRGQMKNVKERAEYL